MPDDRSPSAPLGELPPVDRPPAPAAGSPFQLAMLAILLALLGFVLINFVGDVAAWYLAVAQEHHLQRDREDTNGELQLALQAIDEAIQASPERLSLLLLRSSWRRDAKDYAGALADIDLVESLLPTGDQGFQVRTDVMQKRGLIYQRQGKHAAAVAEQTRMIDQLNRRYAGATSLEAYRDRMAEALNNRAYFRAIGEIDLEGALQDIEESLKLAGYQRDVRNPGRLDEAVKRDTKGYLLYLLKDYPQALDEMELAILYAENDFSMRRMYVLNEFRTTVDRRPIHLHLRTYEEALSVLYHHRGLIYEKLGRRFDAQTDFDRAQRLGYNPARGVF